MSAELAITVNGEAMRLPAGASVADLLERLRVSTPRVRRSERRTRDHRQRRAHAPARRRLGRRPARAPARLDARVAVERNREILPKADYPGTPLADGDVFEVVELVGGG